MLIELRIQNLILIESATILFAKGLNVLTGETGSGKSAIMTALQLISGERADLSILRHGSTKGWIEAVFEIKPSAELYHLLEEAGFDTPCEEPLIIRREIAANGKGRAFINQQSVHVSFLHTLTPFFFELIGQHANQILFSTDAHRKILDHYADLTETVKQFAKQWHEENLLKQELDELLSQESKRLRDIDRYTAELEELEEANLKEGEEEELFSEYTLLSNAEELTEKVGTIVNNLSDNTLTSTLTLLQDLGRLDPLFKDIEKSFQSAKIELEECLYTLRNYQNSIDINPTRTLVLNERLTLISKLKRKYGQTISEINSYKIQLKQQLNTLQNADTRIEELNRQIQQLSESNNVNAQALTKKRQLASNSFAQTLTQQLRTLNMPHAELSLVITPQKRSQYGDDNIEFYIKPNKGERSIPVKDCASGGELSRLLLAIQTLLAGKQATPCLIFDEIDANIGGETATIVGEKLKQIATKHQVLCITHFPQVAKQADHHLQITKGDKDGRTITTIQTVKGKSREKELQRMHG